MLRVGSKVLLNLVITFLCLCQAAHGMAIDKVIAFGDSLSDNGNVYSFTQRASRILPNLKPLPQSPPYYHGRFSNGMVWVEDLAQLLNVPLLDYAYGGSWAEPFYDSHTLIPYGLPAQVSMYLNDATADIEKDRHLYVIWSGGNDYSKGRNDIEYATSNTVNAIKKQMEWLIHSGAKHFLILALPDLGTIPGITKQGEKLIENASLLSRLHNQKLVRMIKLERANYPHIDFIVFNMAAYMSNVMGSPEKYHLKNTHDACYHGAYTFGASHIAINDINKAARQANMDIENNLFLQVALMNSIGNGGVECDNPDEYLFWDHMHPTRKMHQLIARTIYDVLSKTS